MKFGSLFTGIGGFDLAFERAGMTCAWQCEIDDKARGVLARRFPNVEIYQDVRTIGKHNLEPVDVICGGFPCQDVSMAGKRKGLDGERSGLWFEFARIIDELEPKWVVIENVPGLLSSNKGRDFAVIIRWLEERGYGVCWRVLDAQNFGVAQRRRRVFIVASFGSGSCAEVLFEREGMCWDTTAGGKCGEEVAYSIRANPSHSGDKGDGGINTTLVCMAHGQSGAEIVSDGSPSLTCNHEMPFVGVRRLTPTECERLQGFPDGWTVGQADSARYKQLGNAVAVPVAEWIGKRIVEAECAAQPS